MDQEIVSRVALTLIPGIGSGISKKLISHLGSAAEVFNQTKSQLKKLPGLGEKNSSALIHGKKYLEVAQSKIDECNKQKTQIIHFNDIQYPKNLAQLHDSPFLFYFKGDSTCLKKKNIAIVGTRSSTNYGCEVTREIVHNLKGLNCNIISGLAYGIDIEAHKAALDNNMSTVGVMASGVDLIYPSLHKKIATQMIREGGLISEYPIGTKPEPSKFPARNRIIAGLSDVTIVVEAAIKGGALITAEMANDYDREVFAVPGDIGKESSAGCNKLIQQNKAHIFTDIGSFLDTMNWIIGHSNQINTPLEINLDELTEDPLKRKILHCLENEDKLELDIISWKTEIPLTKLVILLLDLELAGVIKTLPGNSYKLDVKNISKQVKSAI